ncbi:hypothetical protein FRB95_007823 [Tulasnella sp. JGI-2019a]|nr:hypothetical protein FRB95_007823 [Tulasnella sp. JGI-2019a]
MPRQSLRKPLRNVTRSRSSSPEDPGHIAGASGERSLSWEGCPSIEEEEDVRPFPGSIEASPQADAAEFEFELEHDSGKVRGPLRAARRHRKWWLRKVRRLADSAEKACKAVDYTHDPRGAAMMGTELQIWGDIDHDAIVPLDDHVQEGDYRMYYVMPHYSGSSFAKDCGKRSGDRALRLLVPIIDALIHMHDKGYIHNDLKPGNILLDDDDESMLADFGLSEKGTSWSMAGTPGWKAPEVEKGEEHDEKVDSYGMGRLFWWFMFRPVHHIDTTVGPYAINWAAITAIKVSEVFQDFLRKLLAEDPAERWTLKQLRADHVLIKDYQWKTVPPGVSMTVSEAHPDEHDSALPEVATSLTTSTGVLLSFEPVKSAPVTTEHSEDIVEAMLFDLISSKDSGVPLHLGPTSGKREREASTSIAEPTEDREGGAKRLKGSA